MLLIRLGLLGLIVGGVVAWQAFAGPDADSQANSAPASQGVGECCCGEYCICELCDCNCESAAPGDCDCSGCVCETGGVKAAGGDSCGADSCSSDGACQCGKSPEKSLDDAV